MPKPSTSVDPKVEPKSELEKRTRREFTPEYKLSIIRKGSITPIFSRLAHSAIVFSGKSVARSSRATVVRSARQTGRSAAVP